jgi:peptidoglycan hydrolase-like protein with peptidoglycan-binding domain
MQEKDELHNAMARRMRLALQYAREREQFSSTLEEQQKQLDVVELERLELQLAETQAERDAARQAFRVMARQRESVQKEVAILKSSLAKATSDLEAIRHEEIRNNADAGEAHFSLDLLRRTGRWSRVTAAAVSIFAVATLISTAAFHDAQSNVQKNSLPEVSAVNALETVQSVSDKRQSASDRKPVPQPDKKKTRFARVKAATQRQWGPSLFMTEPGAAKHRSVFDPQMKEQQENLLTLGFDVGKADGFEGERTRRAIAEFRALYLPHSAEPPPGSVLASIIRNYANLARSDADRFGIDHGVVAAIRLSSVRTGVDFSYLMKLAYTESNFEPASGSTSSSATGMYQFTRDTWLNALKMHGEKYGLADYAAKIEYYMTQGGYRRPMVRDKTVYEHLLALRKNPRVSAMMAAESMRDSQQKLTHLFDREPTQADLYLTHFLGTDGAITFLTSLEQKPDTFAVELFPDAAGSNHDIFHPQICAPRTVDEVYELFDEKFSTRRYDDLAANQ